MDAYVYQAALLCADCANVIRKLDPDERYLGSLVASIACLMAGWWIGKRWDVVGTALILYAVVGGICRFDLFSICLML